MVFMLSLSLAACGAGDESPQTNPGKQEMKNLTEGQTNEGGLRSATSIAEQEIVSIADNCEFYVDYTDITGDVMPPQPGDWYSHYEADDGKVYIDFCVGYKNWKTKDVGSDDVMSAVLTYGGKYEYTGFSVAEGSNRSDFTYSNITSVAPLAMEYLHYLFEVPEEVENSSEAVEIKFTIDGNTYSYKVR